MVLKTMGFLVALCLTVTVLPAQSLRVRLVEELRIGDEEQADLEYLFATPTVMAVADDGSFYVGEHAQKTIRQFDAEGRHLRTFGGPGEAPGEFTEFSSFIVDESGDLLVVDRLGQRITRFPSDGGDLDAQILVTDRLYQAYAAAPLRDGRVAIAAGIGYAENADGEYGLVSVFGASHDRPDATLAPAEELFDMNEPFDQRRLVGSALNMTSDGNRTVYVAKKIYDGVIHRFDETDNGWQRRSLPGFEVDDPPYRFLDKSFSQIREEEGDFSRYQRLIFMSGSPKPFTVEYWASSSGMFVLSDGRLVHFFTTDHRNATVLLAKVFDAEGSYLGTAEVRGIELARDGDKPTARIYPRAIDAQDRIYLVDRTSGTPIIRKMRLEID